MKWTKRLPRKEGVYWFWDRESWLLMTIDIVDTYEKEVYDLEGNVYSWWDGFWWSAEPLKRPEPPKEYP